LAQIGSFLLRLWLIRDHAAYTEFGFLEQRYGHLVKKMDADDNASVPFAKLQRLKTEAEAEKSPALTSPSGIDIRHCSMNDLFNSFNCELDAIITDLPYDR
jgi:hypothetical protein